MFVENLLLQMVSCREVRGQLRSSTAGADRIHWLDVENIMPPCWLYIYIIKNTVFVGFFYMADSDNCDSVFLLVVEEVLRY